MAPMTRTRATEDGVPTELMRDDYVQRASAGLIVTECVQVSDQGHGIITDAVHAAGGRIYAQMWHAGRCAHPDMSGGELPVAPSALAAAGQFYLPTGAVPYPVPRALDRAEIPGIVHDFERAAEYAKEAGFDGAELHGAFGSLPGQFLQGASNTRSDDYGGPVKHRARFLLEVVEAMIGVWGDQRVGVRLSPSNRQTGMFDADALGTFGYVVRQLSARRVGYLHLMEPSAQDLATGTV